jgi:hypothetical protein
MTKGNGPDPDQDPYLCLTDPDADPGGQKSYDPTDPDTEYWLQEV